jgi:hypothetical protein
MYGTANTRAKREKRKASIAGLLTLTLTGFKESHGFVIVALQN